MGKRNCEEANTLNIEITEEANYFLNNSDWSNYFFHCVQMLSDIFDTVTILIDCIVDPDDEDGIETMEFSVESNIGRKEFRQKSKAAYRECQKILPFELDPTLVIRRN